MHDNRSILEGRVRRALAEKILPACYTELTDLDVTCWQVPDPEAKPVTPAQVPPFSQFRPFAIGEYWGRAWETVWMRMRAQTAPLAPEIKELLGLGARTSTADTASADGVCGPDNTCGPDSTCAADQVEILVNLGWQDHSPGFQAEGLVHRTVVPEGAPAGTDQAYIGPTVKAINPKNLWIPARKVLSASGDIDFTIEAAANPILLDVPPFQVTYEGDIRTSSARPLYQLVQASVVLRHGQVYQLALDMSVLHEMVAAKPELDGHDWLILRTLSAALDQLDLADIPATAARARELLQPVLTTPAHVEAPQIYAVGHAHIDSAWLWPLRETPRKVNRTLANVVNLLEQGEDMYFAFPAAQHAAWLAEEDPELFARVRNWVAKGRIVPVGGMWVESDAVLPGGEAMCRQFVEGQAFFEEAFGVECSEVWLPDSFGYSAALPQIAREAGIKRFLTQKISWNQVNAFPHHTFLWEGIDGSRIFTHFPPADTYGSDVTGAQIRHAVINSRDKGHTSVSLLPYGYGDGGGGPTREMLGRLARQRDLAGAPRLLSASPHDFFDRAIEAYEKPPVWAGELYLELHRGTFTSHVATKRGNRETEALLRETELWCTTAAVRGLMEYPYEELRALWRQALLCQFHDILPGSAISWVYREVAGIYAHLRERCEALTKQALQALTSQAAKVPNALATPSGTAGTVLRANATSFTQDGVPPFAVGYVGARENSEAGPTANNLEAGPDYLSNGLLTLRFADGACVSLQDRSGREYIPRQEAAGTFQVHQDFPNMWDAWDIDPFYRGSEERLDLQFGGTEFLQATNSAELAGSGVAAQTAELVSTGIAAQTAELVGTAVQAVSTARYGDSELRITWQLRPGEEFARVRVDADWHEHEKLLKLAFPVRIHTDRAQYETQMGYIERPTHTNTSWDASRFEVSCHRWLRLANAGASLAIANDATYGWDITRHQEGRRSTYSRVRATLLKCARYPDPEQDQGQFSWNFRLHPGASVEAAIADGQDICLGTRYVSGTPAGPAGPAVPAASPVAPLFRVEGAVVESVAMAPDRSGNAVVRIYEGRGATSHVTIQAPEFSRAWCTDLRYRSPEESGYAGPEMRWDGKAWQLELAPFQIATIRFERAL
ncbi:alpha-mannosidase [Actinobaculum suis]|uniref:Alpha-mannosidase n=1 Tax=Actinobaculum suis TaxID=1657 RepID=A0A7Z9CA12_9ACTO|nr:glycoside hydrolase family 38 C-terminal domain-containing protein [Actinobaculum suis]VDG76792.1 alpha-mannosidase [Actinobaculum suis]